MGTIKLHSLNDVKMVGRLTRDPELRYTTQGTPVCRFRIAVGRKFKDRNSGEWREEVAFVPCNVWRETAECCGQRLKKGSPVFVEGRLRSKEWQTKEGQKRSDLELEIQRVQFLESMGTESGETPTEDNSSTGESSPPSEPVAAGVSSGAEANEEVPF